MHPLFYSYRAFGLNIRSTVPLPQLAQDSDSLPDVSIHLGRVEEIPLQRLSIGILAGGDRNRVQVFHEEVGRLCVTAGSEIVFDPVAAVDENMIQRWIIEAGLSLLLLQRGYLNFHGSAVSIDGGATAFLGGSRWGKSTMAAALHQRGHDIIADDAVVIPDWNEQPMILPDSPEIRLWPDAAESLGHHVDEMPRVHPQYEKRIRAVRRMDDSPLPLRCLYILTTGDSVAIAPVTPREGVIELVRHSSWAELFHLLDPGPQFTRCARLAQAVPIRRLERPRILSAVPSIAQLIEEDAARCPLKQQW